MKTVITSPHDRLFRSAMSNIKVAREYFLQNLPKNILALTDLNTLKFCQQSYIDEELKLSQSDVLYSVKLAGKTAYLYMLCEHQSTPDILIPYRVIKYEINIWTEHLKQFGGHSLPLIVTTVFYNGREPYTYSTDFRNLLNAPKDLIEEVWRQPFKLVDAHDITDEEIREHKWFGLLSFFMGHVYAREFLPHLKKSMKILRVIESENGADYIVSLLNYALSAAEMGSIENFVDTIKEGLSSNTGEKVMTIAEQLIARGEQRGIQQGMQQGMKRGRLEGKLEGERLVLVKLLKSRFGNVSSDYLEKVQQADSETLLELAEKILEVKSIEDVFKNLY